MEGRGGRQVGGRSKENHTTTQSGPGISPWVVAGPCKERATHKNNTRSKDQKTMLGNTPAETGSHVSTKVRTSPRQPKQNATRSEAKPNQINEMHTPLASSAQKHVGGTLYIYCRCIVCHRVFSRVSHPRGGVRGDHLFGLPGTDLTHSTRCPVLPAVA